MWSDMNFQSNECLLHMNFQSKSNRLKNVAQSMHSNICFEHFANSKNKRTAHHWQTTMEYQTKTTKYKKCYKKNWSFQSRWFVLCCFLLPFPYDAYVISFQSANKNRLEHLDSNQNLLSFLCYAVLSTVFFTCAPSFLNHKCIGFLSICMYCRLST